MIPARQRDALVTHYMGKRRIEAARKAIEAVSDVRVRIGNDPVCGIEHPRGYEDLKRPGLLWVKEHRYWFAYKEAKGDLTLVAMTFEPNLPIAAGRLDDEDA